MVTRSRRDWIVDITAIAVAACFSVLTSGVLFGEVRHPHWLLVLDQIAAAGACAALWLRRRHPFALALVLVVLSAFSHFMGGPLWVALFTAAVHCRPRAVALLVGIQLLLRPIGLALRPESQVPDELAVAASLVAMTAVISWGMTVRYRRRLIATLYEQAQRATRESIAREMHDVLAHRLSLLSVHAGALEYAAGASPQDVRRAAGVIRSSAHQALEELRDVIGVLRAAPGEEPGTDGTRPQPTHRELPRLAQESRLAGARVTLDQRLAPPDADALPENTGRTVYRIVQEGLTNARKHAPGAETTVTVDGARGTGVTVEIRNPLGAPQRPGARLIPGSGRGLTGLRERVALAGGRIEAGRDRGHFRLHAWLPWPP
ncbi:sensor histidine kinase [Streptomyces sp. NRRL F-2890]|uniref:sensor histidine kinase n=1 Tax=Streptomyces sp. NRRL F-2890 TaxID=1463845 RepID=UPI000694AFE3|nr:histidine kinase [Streptomyces sp. NRRL F-2890]